MDDGPVLKRKETRKPFDTARVGHQIPVHESTIAALNRETSQPKFKASAVGSSTGE
jgi:hypothetical protein